MDRASQWAPGRAVPRAEQEQRQRKAGACFGRLSGCHTLDKHPMTRIPGFCTGNTISHSCRWLLFFGLSVPLWLLLCPLRYRGGDFSFRLFSNASKAENKCAGESTGLADQHNMLCDGTLTPLLCLLLFLLLCLLLLFPLLLHCELQLLQRVCLVHFVGARRAPTCTTDAH